MDEDNRPTPNPEDVRTPSRDGAGPQRCLGGRFVLQDRIGAGGGAVVVRARDRQFSKDVAIKLLRSRDTDLQGRFTQESEVLREMDHPSIVRVLAHDRDGDDLYTALELMEGHDLGDQLLRGGPLPWRQVLEIGIQIASALEATHRKGLVHRDVKPANIMLADECDLADECQPVRVKLIDFGIVRVTENYRLGARSAQRRPTDVGKALGTPGYLPLEAGLVPADARFDVFGLGATLYELVTGTLPELPLRPLREACSGCDAPDDLGLVLAAALALEPEDRTQSAAELGRALAGVRAAHPDRGAPAVRIDGRYELIGLAGTGAKGEAHLAVHRGAGHDVILKFLRSEAPDDALRFAREAILLQTFDHPALPRFYDFAPAAEPPYIAMAHAPGELAARLCSPPRLKPAEVASVGLKLAQVLTMVHARGVLHRDINANNVIIDARGAVTLLDFGCAELGEKFYDVPAGARRYLTPPEARVTIPDGGIGTLNWSAPEVHAGRGWSDRSDVYSLALLLFRLLTGKVPTKGADPPTSPLAYASVCPEDLAAAIVAALRLDPRERPSAAQFAKTLEDVLETEEEALTRVLTMPPRADRPPLHLVPAPSHTRGWTEHALPEPTLEPVERDPVSLQQPSPPPAHHHSHAAAPDDTTARIPLIARRSQAWVRSSMAGALALTIGGLVWWVAHQAPLETTVVDRAAAVAIVRPEPKTEQAPQPVLLVSTATAKLGTMHEALKAAAPDLRHCAGIAGEPLVVEFTINADSDHFGSVASGSALEAVDRCIRDATINVRFAPQGPEKFTQEYTP